MNALAPSISHALSVQGGSGAALEICSATAATTFSTKKSPLAKATVDCAYCAPHAGSHMLLPGQAPALPLAGGHALRPFLFYHAPQPLLALSAAPPRGPPLA